jgi:pyruvate,orthophosphate dikinase
MPEAYSELITYAKSLEKHYTDVQDIEFTIENGKLWLLQTRDAKRTAQASVRIAVELAEEWIITKEQALLRVSPEQVDFFLHPQFKARRSSKSNQCEGKFLAKGLNVSPGAAVGAIAFDADLSC